MSEKRCLVVPGPFLPYNEANILLAYKHLRLLPMTFDVCALRGLSTDKTLLNDFTRDPQHNKFDIREVGKYNDVLFSIKNVNLFKGLRNMRKYVSQAISMYDGQEYLYTMSFPCYTTRVGVALKKEHPELIWIAAFSDPINHNPYKFDPETYKSYSLPEKIAFKLYLKYYVVDDDEANAFDYADHLVFICEEQRDFMIGEYLKYYHHLNKEDLLRKSVIVPLNYIPEWNQVKPVEKNETSGDTFILAHFGRVYGHRLIREFIYAVKEFVQEYPDLPLCIEQYGDFRRSDRKLIRDLGLNKYFMIHKKIPYEECIAKMNLSDAVLLFDTILPEDTIQPFLPSKIIEYSLLNKDVLAVATSKSPTYRIMKDSQAVACRYDRKDILEGLKKIVIDRVPSQINYEYTNEEAIQSLLNVINQKN